jgi:hypothetical protein
MARPLHRQFLGDDAKIAKSGELSLKALVRESRTADLFRNLEVERARDFGRRTNQGTESSNRDKRFCFSGPKGSDFMLAVTVISEKKYTEKDPKRTVPAEAWYKNSGT